MVGEGSRRERTGRKGFSELGGSVGVEEDKGVEVSGTSDFELVLGHSGAGRADLSGDGLFDDGR